MSEKIVKLDFCESTNKYIKENLENFFGGAAVFTLNQTGGRGRLGRRWLGGEGDMLAFSALIDLAESRLSREDIPLISLVTAISVADELKSRSIPSAEYKIKWPNDVLLSEGSSFKKVCGILCEGILANDAELGDKIVVGVGINLFQSAAFFRENGLEHADSIARVLTDGVEPMSLAESLRNRIFNELEIFCEDKSLYLKERFAPLDLLFGRNVAVLSLGGEVVDSGIVSGVSSDGALVLKKSKSGELKRIYAGDISVRQMGKRLKYI